jgi:hypothetical protein
MKLMKPPYKWTNTGQANTRATGTDGSFGGHDGSLVLVPVIGTTEVGSWGRRRWVS